jgi:uncharacterized protein YecA (UPF0149 family)
MGFFDKIAGVFGPKRPKEADLQRNDPCWCGSGKKYKKCHYEGDRKRGAGKGAAKKPS